MGNEPRRKEIKRSNNKDMKNKEVRNKPTPHCQSRIMLFLFMSAEKMLEKNSGHFLRVPLQDTPSPLMDWFFTSVKLLSQPSLLRL